MVRDHRHSSNCWLALSFGFPATPYLLRWAYQSQQGSPKSNAIHHMVYSKLTEGVFWNSFYWSSSKNHWIIIKCMFCRLVLVAVPSRFYPSQGSKGMLPYTGSFLLRIFILEGFQFFPRSGCIENKLDQLNLVTNQSYQSILWFCLMNQRGGCRWSKSKIHRSSTCFWAKLSKRLLSLCTNLNQLLGEQLFSSITNQTPLALPQRMKQ